MRELATPPRRSSTRRSRRHRRRPGPSPRRDLRALGAPARNRWITHARAATGAGVAVAVLDPPAV